MNEGYAFDNFDQMRDEWRQKSLGEFFKRMLQTPSQAGAQGGNPMANAQAMGAKGFDDSEAFQQAPAPMSFPDSLAAIAGAGQAKPQSPDVSFEPEMGGFGGGRPGMAPSPRPTPPPPQRMGNDKSPTRSDEIHRRSTIGDKATQMGPKPSPKPQPTQTMQPFSHDPMSGAAPGQGGGFLQFFQRMFGGAGGASPSPEQTDMMSGMPMGGQPPSSAGPPRPGQTLMRFPVPPGYKQSWSDPIGAWREATWGQREQ